MGLNETYTGDLLAPFNKTRVPSSKGSKEVQDFVINEFISMNQTWTVELQNFEENGYNFTNMIFGLGSNDSYLILAAHYDSKLTPDGFIGGIDSAAPCGILLYLSHFIDDIITEDAALLDPVLLENFTGVKMIFFDGEEAFNEWTTVDSLYGSRYAAEKWGDDGSLVQMELFVLLDLLGGDEPIKIPNYSKSTRVFYKTLQKIERKYNKFYGESHKIFENSVTSNLRIADDHTPFLERGVNVLHLIPFPFPSSWHTIEDNYRHLDEKHIHKWCILMCEFITKFWNPDSIAIHPLKPKIQDLNS
ncbi:unnamed protein product [Kluyveromyces dobzhanskii CBS 2104]|uniref:Peptide hydrolase n=1 Tax=Kluyveromyces dobzhanskii CBS 2104 TaxID=1427455 RepID=A0A0A8L1M2_9SACH|nr:unnamed protein product [Kluyveromyces dobzhanskii CBS 2104]